MLTLKFIEQLNSYMYVSILVRAPVSQSRIHETYVRRLAQHSNDALHVHRLFRLEPAI